MVSWPCATAARVVTTEKTKESIIGMDLGKTSE